MRLLLAIAISISFTSQACIIPVVVHVIHKDNSQKISEQTIAAQLEQLNLDFSASNADTSDVEAIFKSFISDAGIQFQLAYRDTNGSVTDGVEYYPTTHAVFGNNDIYSTADGGADAWNRDQYLNIWICDLAPGINGLSGVPGSTDAFKDGVVIDYESFTTSGRTLTHEVGHWLGLNHTEGNGDCSSDDGVTDTPNQSSAYYNCETGASTCGSRDMVQNFMQSNEDDCLLFFTLGQTQKMQSVMSNERKALKDNASYLLNTNAEGKVNFQVYPTCIKNQMLRFASRKEEEVVLHAYSSSGEKVFSRTLSLKSGENSLELGLETGVYFLSFEFEQTTYSQKIVVQ